MTRSLVIGGTRGIGLEIVAHFKARGDDVEGIGRNGVAFPKPRNYLVFSQRYRGDDWLSEITVALSVAKNAIDALQGYFPIGQDNAIVVVSSINAALVNEAMTPAYHACKAAQLALVRYWAVTLGPLGIRVNAVSPGTVHKGGPDWPNKAFHERIAPLRRMGSAREVAAVVGFLCSPAASFVTGQNIVVDGGVSLQWQESLAAGVSDEPAR